MFWKHRKLRLWLLCLLSSALLCTGYSTYIAESYPYSETTSTTAPIESTWAENATLLPSDPGDTAPTGVTGTDKSFGSPPNTRSLSPYFRTASLLSGVILGLIFVFTRLEKPLMGPEWDIAGIVTGYLALLHLRWYSLSVQSVIFCAGLWALILLSLRELLWWLLQKLPVCWSSFHRIGLAAALWGGKQLYLLCHTVLCMLSLLCIVKLCMELRDYRLFLMLCPFLVSILLSWLNLWQLGADLDHLTQQIGNVHQGAPVDTASSSFKKEVTQLAGLQTQIDEAVHTALTGERFKVELISNVSHDLRTPLTAILGYGELLQKETLSEVGRQQLDRLNQKAGYMRELVDSVFELTKVSSGSVEPKFESIDLIRLLEQTIGLFDEELRNARLQVRRHYESEKLPIITDGSRMHQVFANLLGNAVKYALQGSRVHLHVSQTDKCCSVRMTNIAAYEMDFQPEEILQRFARGDKARTTSGNGIGLAIAQTYTQSVGGSFRVSIDAEQFSAIVELPKT